MQVNMDSYSSFIISDIQDYCYLFFLRYMFILKLIVAKKVVFFNVWVKCQERSLQVNDGNQ